MTKFAAVLACRNKSTRLYAKPLQLVGNKPIIMHVVDRIKKQCRSVTEIVFAISKGQENIHFELLAKEHDIPYIYGDEKDVLGRLIEAGDLVTADVVLRITTENPFPYVEKIDEMYDFFTKNQLDLMICENIPVGAQAEIITMDALRRSHTDGEDRHRSELISLYINENPDKFKIHLYPVEEKLRRPEVRLTVDNPEDLIVVRRAYDALYPNCTNGIVRLKDVVAWLDKNPEIKKLNQDIPAGTARTWP
jgi:spore coat polysaccharide biosynthesis protein SpsF